MLVLSNPIRSTEETENKLIEKRANNFPQSIIDAANAMANIAKELNKTNAKQKEEQRKKKYRERNEDDYNSCMKGTGNFIHCRYYLLKV